MPGSAAAKRLDQDPTVYPIEDDVGEGSLQRFISELLRMLIEIWLRSRGRAAFVGADQYFYWQQYNPSESVAPDVYVLPGVPPGVRIGAWKVWETGRVPSFAFEVVSQNVEKDYLQSPAKYDRLGVEELIVFDPDHRESSDRVRWQIFRRTPRGFLRVEATALAPRLISREYLTFATDARLDSIINAGVPGTTMLGWGKGSAGMLDATQIRSLIYFLRAQQASAPSDPKWKEGRKVPIP